MKSILATTLLATTALASTLRLHPDHPTPNNNTIQTRQATAEGVTSGIKISIYTKPNCKGEKVVNDQTMLYAKQFQNQLQSYKLSDDLGPDDLLSFWADVDWTATGDKPIDKSLNGNPAACATFAYNAAVVDTTKGCHSLANVVGCVSIWVNEAPH